MTTLTLKRGAPLLLSVVATDEYGVPFVIPGSYSAVSRLCFNSATGPEAAVLAPVISGGLVRVSRDTADLEPATYVLDVKLKDAAGLPVAVTADLLLIIEPSPSTP